MDKGSLEKSFIDFEQRVNDNLNLISKINQLNSDKKILTENYLDQITELAFLKIYISWELFLEDIFIKLILISKNYYKVKSYVRPKNYSHANELLKENNKYFDWTDINNVIFKSENYFLNGFPLSNNLKLIKTELIEMKRIRNGIVHMSQKARDSFKSLVIEKEGFCPKNYSCGKFLLKTKDQNYTYLNFYITKMTDVAKRICSLK